MIRTCLNKFSILALCTVVAIIFASSHIASAHCDTLDGPVIQDANTAIKTKDINPVLKWVKPKDEKAVRAAFKKVLASNSNNRQAAENNFFTTLVKIHRTGEGAPFTGLKPAGAVEPAIAEADKALASSSSDALVKMITDDISSGIKQRFEHAAAAYKHKDESVAQGREFVEAYVEFTHYVERVHKAATGNGAHAKQAGHEEHKEHGKH